MPMIRSLGRDSSNSCRAAGSSTVRVTTRPGNRTIFRTGRIASDAGIAGIAAGRTAGSVSRVSPGMASGGLAGALRGERQPDLQQAVAILGGHLAGIDLLGQVEDALEGALVDFQGEQLGHFRAQA